MTATMQASGLVALADRIELWPIEKLRPYERNPRTHSDEQVDQIAASMVEFGWTNPVLVDEQGGILAGHGRLLAARKLGLAEVPVIRFEHLSEAQKRAYILADNQIALQAGWSEELLAAELAWLRDERFDLDLVGFDASELERLLALADGDTARDDAEDEVPEPPEDPVSQPGDLWILGNHRLLCGDATVLADVERVLGGQLADMTFCDPPYNVDYANTPKDKLRGKHRPIMNDNLGGGFEAFLYDACVNILSVTKGACYVCMSSSELDTLQKAFRAAGGKWSTFVIWAKNTFTLGRADYQRQYEPILYGWKEGSDHYWCGARVLASSRVGGRAQGLRPCRGFCAGVAKHHSGRGDLLCDHAPHRDRAAVLRGPGFRKHPRSQLSGHHPAGQRLRARHHRGAGARLRCGERSGPVHAR